jgi:hypothetical protein
MIIEILSKTTRPTSPLLPLASVLALLACLLIVPSAVGRSAAPRAHAASSFLTGIGDEHPEMFTNPRWKQLHTKIARYIAPYDAAARGDELATARAWIHAAETAHVQVLVAFYHSEHTPTKLPSVATYQADVKKFIKDFPRVKQYQAYDEANRGNVRGAFASPSASLDAQYYQALIRVCKGCTVIGLDVLDARQIGPTLQYISEFKYEISRLDTVMPKIWGLHDYSDVNRLESWRTAEIDRALGGQVWLTETGGIVQFGGEFPNIRGSGLTRAAKVVKFVFSVARSQPQIKRVYLFDWTGGVTSTKFDAGLMDARYNPRPGYVVVCRELHAAKCNLKTSKH